MNIYVILILRSINFVISSFYWKNVIENLFIENVSYVFSNYIFEFRVNNFKIAHLVTLLFTSSWPGGPGGPGGPLTLSPLSPLSPFSPFGPLSKRFKKRTWLQIVIIYRSNIIYNGIGILCRSIYYQNQWIFLLQ